MKPTDIAELAAWAQGQLVQGASTGIVRSISTDSRLPMPAALFVPLVGERFDGHDFVQEAVDQGAVAVLVDHRRLDATRQRLSAKKYEKTAIIQVDDTLRAFQRMARAYRQHITVPVIGITGSNGKTTTKDMLHHILATEFPTAATTGNDNNHIGVPKTIFSLEPHHGALIVEMGINEPDEMELLVSMAQPTVGVVTNVGPAHLEHLEDVDGVAKEKRRLLQSLPDDGIAVLNMDDDRVRAMGDGTLARVVTFGTHPQAAVRAETVESRGFDGSRMIIRCEEERFPVTLKAVGRHQVMNALAAAAVALSLQLPPTAVQEGLLRLPATPMRMQVKWLEGNTVLIDDAYNASPRSMQAALQFLSETEGKRKVAVLGGMLELGADREHWHRRIGERAAQAGVDVLICVGREGQWIGLGALDAGMPQEKIFRYPDVATAEDDVAGRMEAGDVILVKASRGFRFERLSHALEVAFGSDFKTTGAKQRL